MHRAGECMCTPVSRAPARFGWDVEITGGEPLGAFLKLKERTKPKALINWKRGGLVGGRRGEGRGGLD